MEKIKINSIESKGDKGLVIVGYNPVDSEGNVSATKGEATMNKNYQGGQNVNYIENEVGIGGIVSVLIKQNGKYINIDEVDMESAEKGAVAEIEQINNGLEPDGKKWRTPKEIKACVLTGCVCRLMEKEIEITGKDAIPVEVIYINQVWAELYKKTLETYNFFLKNLEPLKEL